jgi:serine/threonine protein kinase
VPDVLKTVGRYEIVRVVGRGGMAMVYLARQTDLDRFVALKELAAFHASDAAFAQRFLRGSLRPFVGHLTLAQIGGVLEGLLAGLALAGQNGIVHRDLKPENLMVTADGRVKIADFGIAKATGQIPTGAFVTATGTTVGTPVYMAPEQAMGHEVGPWSDLYSVGCMAFELFVGRPPFHDSEAPMAILLRHLNEPIPAVSSLDPSVDRGISDWIERLLVKDPTQRVRSAADAWDELEEPIIALVGPRWRRSARLSAPDDEAGESKPLTPAPFETTAADRASPRLGSAGPR